SNSKRRTRPGLAKTLARYTTVKNACPLHYGETHSCRQTKHLGTSRTVSSPSLPSLQLAADVVAVEPRGLKHGLVAAEALAQGKFHVAFEPRPGRDEMIFARPLARSQHGRLCPRHAEPLIGGERRIEIVGVARDRGCEHAGVFDRHG